MSTKRFVSVVSSRERRVVSQARNVNAIQAITYAACEMDSHADTVVCGSNCIVLHYTNRVCDVTPFTDKFEAISSVPIATCATAYTCQQTGETYILVFHEALWMGDTMSHTLVNPNQMRYYGTVVQDNPFDPQQLHLRSQEHDVIIPMQATGTIVGFDSRTPTQEELQTCLHIELTSPHPWNPHDVQFPEPVHRVEEEMLYGVGATGSRGLRLMSAADSQNRSAFGVSLTDFKMDSDEFVEAGFKDTIFDVATFASKLASSVTYADIPNQKTSVSQVDIVDVPERKTFVSGDRHSAVSAEELSDRWGVGLLRAKQTLKVTTQKGIRSALLPLSRRYRADRIFDKRVLPGKWFTDTMDGRCKSLDGNRYAQVFTNKQGFVEAYPMEKKSQAGQSLRTFVNEFGIPGHLTFDGSKEQTGKKTEFMSNVRKYDIHWHVTEPERHNQNYAERVIGELRKKWFRIMVRKNVPSRLWDYGFRWVCEIQRVLSSESGGLEGRTPMEAVTGETPDISEYLDFGFYDWCWYRANAGVGPTQIGRWLGVSHRVGGDMSYWVLTVTGEVINVVSRTTVQRVTNLELQINENITKCAEFDAAVAAYFQEGENFIMEGKIDPEDWADLLKDDPDFQAEFDRAISDNKLPEADDAFTPEVFDDTYLNMELVLPRSAPDTPEVAKVVKRLRDKDGRPIGRASDNPILDTRVYEVEYLDGHREAVAANVIAENLFAQVDDEGNRQVFLKEIIDHRTTGKQVPPEDAFVTLKNGVKRRRQTTVGWEILCEWKDGSSTWVALKDLKESYPVQLAEYAIARKISDLPAFAWWVPFVLKKRSRIVAKVKSKYWLRTHKYGIQIPKSVSEAERLDVENGDTLWMDAIRKEMANVRPAFELWEKPRDQLPVGYQEIKCHMVFDVKLGENFRRKARFVAGGHTTDAPSSITYASVVSRESVRVCLLLAALNDLQILGCDIQNAYLAADCRERIFTVAGPEFGSEKGSLFIIKKALYGLKSSGAAFRALCADTLRELGYLPSKADPDVWMRPAIKPDGFEYWEYVLCYVDDLLSLSHKPEETMEGIRKTFTLKGDKAEKPSMYLGAQLSEMVVDNGTKCWSISAEKYVTLAVANVEEKLNKEGNRLPSRCYTPLSSNYRPELDVSSELKADGVQYYQELIGILRWAVELGRLDILHETSVMSSYMAMPRLGQLQQLYHMFGYLKLYPKRKIAMDPTYPRIDERRFQQFDWTDFYKGVQEAIPEDAPMPRGRFVSMHAFVDASHASNVVNRRSHTGVLIFCCRAPIVSFSKRQNAVETSTFGSEFTAMKVAVELVESLRYKLRMFGVPLEGPTDVFCDNEAVFKNTSRPESTLKKKQHSIAYHKSREAVASGTIRVAKEGTATNLSDIFTKTMSQANRDELLDRFMY